jgi:thymidylate synthase ThyX
MPTADDYLTTVGQATVVQGLPEEAVAMLFGMFSRNPRNLRDTLQTMIDDGDIDPPPFDSKDMTDRVRSFHERITIGYGHKSVADHAMVHFCLEGVSALAERDFLSARLLAASSKSTRFVDFSNVGWVTPEEINDQDLRFEYDDHCLDMMRAYEYLVPRAVDAVREVCPYVSEEWNGKEKLWEGATHKRALDSVRDVLPMSARTNFAVTMSATGLREMLDKRQSDLTTAYEIREAADSIRLASKAAVPTLLPDETRIIRRQPMIAASWTRARIHAPMTVRMVTRPDWSSVETILGESIQRAIHRWTNDRTQYMVPDRTAEAATYAFIINMPIAIHRDLGRHRPLTQLQTLLGPGLGYGVDPLLIDQQAIQSSPKLVELSLEHAKILQEIDERLMGFMSRMNPTALQYACPLATMVRVAWVVNLRELVHILGLRTVKQGHAGYRLLVQMVAKAVKAHDPMIAPLVDSVTNFDQIIVGRPG